MPKSILYSHWSNSVQKTAQKNTKYSRNETIFAKYSIWTKILNCLKYVKIDSVFTLE